MTLYLLLFFNDTATTEIYTLSLHDALPFWPRPPRFGTRMRVTMPMGPQAVARYPVKNASAGTRAGSWPAISTSASSASRFGRSEEHTSELQSRQYLVCRLLLEKKKKQFCL